MYYVTLCCLNLILSWCSYATVRIRVHKTFVNPSPVRVLCLSESPSRGSKSCFPFSWHISADYDAKFHDLYEHFCRKWKWRFIDKARSTRRQRHRANAPVESIEDYYCVCYFLPFIDHIISHLNSQFPQELKVIFESNYLVPALVNNVNPEIVNDIKTEYMNDLLCSNDL
jgi:hypothetical protein